MVMTTEQLLWRQKTYFRGVLKYYVRLKLLVQLVHMRERNAFAAGHPLNFFVRVV